MADFHGPVFDGLAERLSAAMCDDAEQSVADLGVELVRANLGQVLRHPTGRYSSSIEAAPGDGTTDVTDGGIVYGPWLEGVGSRNRTTRFKGYATFRRTAQELQRRAMDRAAPIVDAYVRRMG